MAQTNVQAFSGDVAISSNLAVDTNTLFVDSVGNKVGIGTASPGAPLHIYKREDTFGSLVELLRLERYTNDFDNRIDAAGGYIGFHANDGNSAIGEVARISFRQKGESSTANAEDDGGMGFWTKLDDSLAERVTITPNGNVGIGTTNPGSYKLDVNGTVHLPSIHRTNFTKELSEYFELESGAATEVTLNSLLVEINVSGTSYTDQSEYAGTIDLDIIAQRTNSAYGLDIVKTQLHFTAGWNEQYDAWERLRFNQEIKAQDIESYRSITTVPVFRYTYTSRKLQIYIQYNALQYRVKHSFTARVTSDEPFAGDIISYPGGAPMSGTDAAAFQCLSYGTSGNVGIGTNSPTAALHVNGNKAIINGQSSVQTVNVYKTAGGNSGAQTRRYYRVYVPNTYNNFQIIFRGFARNYSGGGDIQAWRRQYTIQRNSGHNIVITHNSGENIDATGFTFTTSQSGGSAGTIEVHFDVTFPAKPEAATYITFKADVIGDSGSFANTSGI